MSTLRRLALATVVVAFGAITLGSWTRINGQGMSCPGWPACALSGGSVWEWTHRLFAMAVAPMVLSVIVLAWRQRRRPFILPATCVIAALFVLQVLLGAATVRLANSPWSVVLHWGTAMAFIAALCAMVVFAGSAPGERNAAGPEIALTGILAGTALVAFVTMCVGAYVSSSGAGLACISVPGCAGHVLVYSQGQYVQMLHRFVAGATLFCASGAFAIAWMRGASVRVRACVSIGLLLLFVQVLLGLLNVALRLPIDLREAHAANAAMLFLAFVVATLFAMVDARGFETAATAP
ncbi:MAG: COX15/CtaA family protein [Vulcanimicrobiaceae bacterium]